MGDGIEKKICLNNNNKKNYFLNNKLCKLSKKYAEKKFCFVTFLLLERERKRNQKEKQNSHYFVHLSEKYVMLVVEKKKKFHLIKNSFK